MSQASGAFVVNVRDIVRKTGHERPLEIDAPMPERLGEGTAFVPAGEPVEVRGLLESVHEGIYASGTLATRADAECSRCVDAFEIDLALDFGELFGYSGGSDDIDYAVEGDRIDLWGVVRDAVVLALPFQPVCRPDCGGLDPETGERLPDGTHWQPAPTIDPRWAALENLTNSEDER